MTAMMLSSVPGMTYALETVSSDADIYEAELTKVSVARSVEELSRKSEAADNEAFFTIDAAKDDTAVELASEEVAESVNDILSEDISASDKQELVADTLEDSGFYRAVEGSGSKVEVTSKFAFQRLRLIADKQKEINAYGATRAVFYKDHYLLSYDSEESTKAAYDALVSEYGSSSVLVDQPVKAEAAAKGWGTNYMKMDHEKIIAAKGRDVTVAVLDTGIKRDHEVFSGRTVLRGYDFVNSDEDPSDDHGHGTAVSGIIAESTPSNVKILPVKVLANDGSGSVEDVMMALAYAEEEHADVVNMSLGGLVDDGELEQYEADFAGCSALVVCASGNGEKFRGSKEYDMDLRGYNEFPAEIESAVSVGSVNTKGIRSSFSNYGQALDFTAPGENVRVALASDGFSSRSGTSFASPYIAAAASLVKAENSEFDNEDVIDHLIGIADDPGDKGWDKYYGNGCPRFPVSGDVQRGGDISAAEADTTVTGIKRAVYTGLPQTQDPIVISDGEILAEGVDYDIRYANNINAGTARMTIIAKGDYSGSIEKTFTIEAKRIDPVLILSGNSYAYTGGPVTPDIMVRDGSKVLVRGTDYDITYSNNINYGTAYASVNCKGNYRGGAVAAFNIAKSGLNIVLKAAKIKKPAKARKAITVKWKKQSAKAAGRRISGYQVQVASDSSFTQGVKTARVKGYAKTSKKITKLLPKTKYYTRVRTYMNYGGRTYYSAWSSVRSAKTR